MTVIDIAPLTVGGGACRCTGWLHGNLAESDNACKWHHTAVTARSLTEPVAAMGAGF